MLKPRPFDFYTFAIYLHPLAELQGGVKFRDNREVVEVFTKADLAATVLKFDAFAKQFLVSSVDCMTLIQGRIQSVFLLKGGKPWPDTVPGYEALWFKEQVHAFETLLNDELGKLPMFLCEEESVGNYAISKLLKGASNGYPKEVRERLTPECAREIDESGRCLAYERSTASGFHGLRSVEITIRQYLNAIPGFTMPPLNRQNWGEYLKLLKDNGSVREVTDHLHNIKDNYRNPLMHPTDTLEKQDSISLFGVVQSMNEMLIGDMLKRGLIK